MNNLKFRLFPKNTSKYLGKMREVGEINFNGRVVSNDSVIFRLEDVHIMQSTGLTDKNGKEIFEGDILRIGLRIYEVIWEDGYYRLFDKKADSKEKYCSLNVKDTEIIGNIHENPEFLNS